ncbi:MAG: hypothetical protein ACLP1X_26730 [Polyangiaceae bacterium]
MEGALAHIVCVLDGSSGRDQEGRTGDPIERSCNTRAPHVGFAQHPLDTQTTAERLDQAAKDAPLTEAERLVAEHPHPREQHRPVADEHADLGEPAEPVSFVGLPNEGLFLGRRASDRDVVPDRDVVEDGVALPRIRSQRIVGSSASDAATCLATAFTGAAATLKMPQL